MWRFKIAAITEFPVYIQVPFSDESLGIFRLLNSKTEFSTSINNNFRPKRLLFRLLRSFNPFVNLRSNRKLRNRPNMKFTVRKIATDFFSCKQWTVFSFEKYKIFSVGTNNNTSTSAQRKMYAKLEMRKAHDGETGRQANEYIYLFIFCWCFKWVKTIRHNIYTECAAKRERNENSNHVKKWNSTATS